MSEDFFAGAEVISAYTRAQALVDGVLVDATPLASEAGFKVPTALTAGAWAETVACENVDSFQDETGRLWDVLTMAMHAARRASGGSQVTFSVLRVPNEAGVTAPTLVDLVMHIGPGDAGEPVLTIMLPGED